MSDTPHPPHSHRALIVTASAIVLGTAVFTVACCYWVKARMATPPAAPAQVANATPAPPAIVIDPNLPNGHKLYLQNCALCHGEKGDGKGLGAAALDPKPRDFTVGKYRIVTSANGIPFKDDVIKTIRRGMPGTAMVAWPQFSDADVNDLADHVLAISRDALKEQLRKKLFANSKLAPDALEKKLEKSTADRFKPEDPVDPGDEPPFTPSDVTAARAAFLQTCAVCHGPDAKGMQNPDWKTEEGLPIASRNLRLGVFKGGADVKDVYARIYAGIPGTPMPTFNTLPREDIWRLAHFVKALNSPDGSEPAVLKGAATQPTVGVTQ